jgi:hypothetical protein
LHPHQPQAQQRATYGDASAAAASNAGFVPTHFSINGLTLPASAACLAEPSAFGNSGAAAAIALQQQQLGPTPPALPPHRRRSRGTAPAAAGTGAAAAADANAALAADGASSQAHTPRAPSRGGNGNGGAGAGSALRDSGADVGGRAAKRARGVGAAAAAAAVEDTDDEMEAAFGAAAGYYGGDDCEDDYDMEDSLISSQVDLGRKGICVSAVGGGVRGYGAACGAW